TPVSAALIMAEAEELSHELTHTSSGQEAAKDGLDPEIIAHLATPSRSWRQRFGHFWRSLDFWLGILTTFLVMLAWSINLIAKPLATAFGGSVALLGMGVALLNYRISKQQGRLPVVVTTGVEGRLPGSVLAVLS